MRVCSATEPVEVLEKALAANGGQEYDVSICVVNVKNCEMSCILPVRDGGTVYFFSMATSFTRAALGRPAVGTPIWRSAPSIAPCWKPRWPTSERLR